MFIPLNEHKTARYFLQNFRCTTMLIYAFCKICKRKCKHEIVFCHKNQNKTISGSHLRSQILQNKYLNNQTNFHITLEKLKKIWIRLVFI